MKTPWMLCIGLFWVLGAWAAEEGATYPLKPVAQVEANGAGVVHRVSLGKDGQGEMPFTTVSGKLRFKKTGDKILVSWDKDGKFAELSSKGEGALIATEVPVTLGGKPFGYPLSLHSVGAQSSGGQNDYICVHGRACLEAQVGQTAVRLYDTNVNGRFGDPGDMLQIGVEGSVRAATKYLEVDGKIQEFQVVNDGEAVKLLPYTGPTATLKVNAPKDGWSAVLQLVHAEGLFVASPKSTDAALVPGAYRLGQAEVQFGDKTDTRGRAEYPIHLYASGRKGGPIQIKEGPNTLAFGPPFRLEFTAGRSLTDPAEVAITDVVLIGAGGEKYRAYNYGTNTGSTLTCSVRSAGKEQEVAKLSYG